MNRKGFVDDIVLYLGLLFVAGIIIFIAYILLDSMSGAVNDQDAFGAKEKGFISDYTTDFGNVWDYTFLTVFISAFIGLLILTWFLQSQPALFFAVLFVVALVGILAAALSNGFENMLANSSLLNATSANFPITNFLMSNLLLFTLGTVFMMFIVFFAKPGGESV